MFHCVESIDKLIEKDKKNKEEKEKCVSCGNLTKYNISDDINIRKHYVETSGQLCSKCWIDIYGGKKNF